MSPRLGKPLRPGMEPLPAPGGLRLVQELVNTRDLATGHDVLSDPRQLAAWMATRELVDVDEDLGQDQWQEVLDLREVLRELIRARTRNQWPDTTAVARLGEMVAGIEVPHRFLVEPDGSLRLRGRVASDGFAGALTRLFLVVAEAIRQGRWKRLKECHLETCCRVFYDSSNNRSGKWCNPRRCGNRTNTTIYRRRKPSWERKHG